MWNSSFIKYLNNNINTIFIILGHSCNLQCKYCLQHDVVNIQLETKINDEYEIDRHELIEKMRKDNARFISVQGREGVGKTVICKKFIDT